MGKELQTTNAGSLAIAKRLYADSQLKALGRLLDIMGTQYRMTITAELSAFWKEALIDNAGLTPEQMHKGLQRHMADPECSGFPPLPGDIVRCAPDSADDKPIRKVDPDCSDCKGSGWRYIQPTAEQRRGSVTRCHCERVEYQGEVYVRERLALTAGEPREKKPEVKVPDIPAEIAKPFPTYSTYMPSEAELERKKQEALELAKKFS